MKPENLYRSGAQAMLPITMGILPFGLVMGAVSADAHLTLFQTVTMNVFVFAGAAQLAAVDLMTHHAASSVVVLTGLIINLRFVLYSAALSPVVQRSPWLVKAFCAHSLTDQTYSVMSAHQHRLKSNAEAVRFYMGACFSMLFFWHSSVIGGYLFGNLAPAAWSLEFAVPLSFVALVAPTLKNRKYVAIAVFSGVISIPFSRVPYNGGLILSALSAIGLAYLLTRKKARA